MADPSGAPPEGGAPAAEPPALRLPVELRGAEVLAPGAECIADALAALANADGGALILGGPDPATGQGGLPPSAVDALHARALQAAAELVQPALPVLVRRVELPAAAGVPLMALRVEVPRSARVHRSRGRYLHRVGGRVEELAPDALAQLFQSRAAVLVVEEPGAAPAPPTPAAPRLRVVWLEVEGLRRLQDRCFFDFRSPRGRPVDQMIIAGTNGGGKTTVLEALLLGLHREALIVRDLPRAERATSWRGRLPDGARVSLCVEHDGRTLRVDRVNGRHTWRAVEHPFAEPGAPVDSGPGDGLVEYFSSWRAPALVGPVWPSAGGRRAADTEANRLRAVKQRLLDRRTLRSYTDRGLHDPWLSRINAAWATFHGQDGTSLADLPVDPADEAAGFDVYVMEPDGRRRCPIDQASAGEIELVCMAGTLTVSGFSGVLLIDEPELHLHPEWQARILPALRALAPEAQIIATSHAPEPWDRAYNYQRYFLAPPGDPRRSDLRPPPERG